MTSVGLNCGSRSADLTFVPRAFSDALGPKSEHFAKLFFFKVRKDRIPEFGLMDVALFSSRSGVMRCLVLDLGS